MAIVSRRYVKKFNEPNPGDDIVGYTSFTEIAKDLHKIVDVLWLSGTRKIASILTFDISYETPSNSGQIADSLCS